MNSDPRESFWALLLASVFAALVALMILALAMMPATNAFLLWR